MHSTGVWVNGCNCNHCQALFERMEAKSVSSNDINGLANKITSDFGELKDLAHKIHDKLEAGKQVVHTGLTAADQSADALLKAGEELLRALGQHTNNPPK